MGLMDFVKGGVGEMMIARHDQWKHLIVFKHPDETVPAWSQLTVDSDEGAVFFKDGQVFGILGPGRHTLSSQNIPFLGQLVDKFTGGNVFKAEVFFVRNQPLRNDPVKFGAKVSMVDPVTKMPCQPMIHGEFVVRVMDPVKFIVGLTGQSIQVHDNQAILKYASNKFVSGVRQALARVLSERQTSILEVDMERDAITEGFKKSVPDLDEVGLQVVEMVDFVVKLAPEDRTKIENIWTKLKVAILEKQAELQMRKLEIEVNVAERQAYVNMAQNPAYMAHAQAEAMMGAGQGMAKGGGGGAGIANLGAQMAVGVGMANMFQQGFYQPAPNHQRVQATAGASVSCGACGAANAGGKFCASCGKPLAPPPSAFCSNCGSAVQGKFCANCGAAGASAGPGPDAPPQGMPPQGMPPQGMPPQGMPPQGMPPQGMPPQGPPPQGMQPQAGDPAAPPGGYPPAPQQGGYPGAPQGYPAAPPQGGYPAAPQGYPPGPQQGGYPAAPQGAPAQVYPGAPGGQYSGGIPGGGPGGGGQGGGRPQG